MADATASITIAFNVVFGTNFIRLMCFCHVERLNGARRLNGSSNNSNNSTISINVFNV
jgi:hypothetical protein